MATVNREFSLEWDQLLGWANTKVCVFTKVDSSRCNLLSTLLSTFINHSWRPLKSTAPRAPCVLHLGERTCLGSNHHQAHQTLRPMNSIDFWGITFGKSHLQFPWLVGDTAVYTLIVWTLFAWFTPLTPISKATRIHPSKLRKCFCLPTSLNLQHLVSRHSLHSKDFQR